MMSRVSKFIPCTFYFYFLAGATIIGFASFIVGCVGLGLFIPTYIKYKNYENNACLIIDVDYDSCQGSCYYVLWSVQYLIANLTSTQYIFATLTQTYDSSDAALADVATYNVGVNRTCYYDTTDIVHVQWDQPMSPISYMVMMIIGFTICGIDLIFIGIFHFCQCRRLIKINSSK